MKRQLFRFGKFGVLPWRYADTQFWSIYWRVWLWEDGHLIHSHGIGVFFPHMIFSVAVGNSDLPASKCEC